MTALTHRSPILVCTRDESVLDAVLAAAAAAGEHIDPITDPAELMPAWSSAGAVFIGADCAAGTVRLGLPARERVHLVGTDAGELARWSMLLGAAVAVIPESADHLITAVLGGADSDTPVVALVGAAGGTGTSTLAAGLALLSRRPALLVDADTGGGGLDLVLGLEAEPGWRWPDLAHARGHLGTLRGQLPRLDEVDLLSFDRSGEAGEPPAEAVAAVLAAGRQDHELVVIDAGRGRGAMARDALRHADIVLLSTTADVRAIAATDHGIRRLRDDRLPVDGVVLRTAKGSGIGAQEVSATVGVPVWATVPHDRGVVAAGRRGGPPDRAAGRRWRRGCLDVMQRVLP
ncbi:septum site-determining protein Ssd [Enemella sp. A6]|uniref:septum site-determining protein Ssd n=1 Tax=Enemella sp. A6 TaxID=3440152 RepID=UPI003EB7B449